MSKYHAPWKWRDVFFVFETVCSRFAIRILMRIISAWATHLGFWATVFMLDWHISMGDWHVELDRHLQKGCFDNFGYCYFCWRWGSSTDYSNNFIFHSLIEIRVADSGHVPTAYHAFVRIVCWVSEWGDCNINESYDCLDIVCLTLSLTLSKKATRFNV